MINSNKYFGLFFFFNPKLFIQSSKNYKYIQVYKFTIEYL